MILGGLDLKTLGGRLKRLDRFLIDVLSIRLAHGGLSDYVAENKRKLSGDGIFEKRRQDVEETRIALMREWAKKMGIDPNFSASLMYQIISESCRVQDELMINKHRRKEDRLDESDPKNVADFQRRELLRLTATVADSYDDDYAKDLFGSEIYSKFERQILNEIISEIDDKSLAVDLGCATGIITMDLAPHFKKVIGYDISPDMIRVAKDKVLKGGSNIQFEERDIEAELDLEENSISLAIMNMGTAGDIRNIETVIACLKRCLKPKGKFFLSFYNSESLLSKMGFVPWPTQLAASIDPDKNCLEVHYNRDVYFLYAKPRSMREVGELLSGLTIEQKYSYPTCASIMPSIILENEDDKGDNAKNKEVRKLIKKIDMSLATSDVCSGTYIIVTGSKP